MLLTIFLVACQAPQVFNTEPPIQRVFRKKQVDRYAVVIDSEGTAGPAHYEYEVRFLAENPIPASTDTKIAATFLGLRAKYGDFEAPVRKAFGSATYQFPKVGFPLDYSLAGKESTFVVPILSWCLPRGAVRPDSGFDVPEMVFDGSIHVKGSGTYSKVNPGEASIKLDLTFAIDGKPAETKPPSFYSTAVFNTKTGVLLKSDGEMNGFGGSMTFHVKRI